MDSPSHSLAFLLSLGAFPLACAGDDGGSSETSTTGSANTTGEPTTSGSGSAASTESGSTGGTSEGTGETSGGGLCEEYAAKYVECLRGTIPEVTSECMMSLEDALTFYGEECQAATKTMLECYAGGTCEDFWLFRVLRGSLA